MRLVRSMGRPRGYGVHFFQGGGGVVVEFEVGGLKGLSTPEIEVRLVPYFEVPLRDFVDAVAVYKVLREGGDHAIPQSVVLWGETFCLYQKACRAAGSEASFLGMKLSSTKGRAPLASRPS